MLHSYPNGAYLARSRRDLAESILETSWIADGVAASESAAVKEMVNIAASHPSIAKSVLDFDWYGDGISEVESRAISHLAAIADADEPTAEIVASLAWFVDGVSEPEVNVVRDVRRISQDYGPVARRIVAMPFLAALEPADIAAMQSLAEMEYFGKRALDLVWTHYSLSEGITDAHSPVVAMLYGVYKNNPALMDTLLDLGQTIVESRTIILPLTGSVDLTIIRTRPGAARSMDLLERAVRTAERLMDEPLPTRYVGLLYENAIPHGFLGFNNGLNMTMLPRFDVDDGTWEAQFSPFGLAHEVAHYYWEGNANWIDEGASELMASVIESEWTGAPVGVANDPCPYVRTISTLSALHSSIYAPAFTCNYSLGERLFVDMYGALGHDAFWERMRQLYQASAAYHAYHHADGGRMGPPAGIEEVREAFGREVAGTAVIARWYDGTVPYEPPRLDTRPADPSLPDINGRIDSAYITLSEDGPPVSTFPAGDATGYPLLILEYSYRITGPPRETTLEIVELYEDGFEFRRRQFTMTAEYAYIGDAYGLLVGSNPPAPGHYWIYVYDGDRKVAEAEFEVTP